MEIGMRTSLQHRVGLSGQADPSSVQTGAHDPTQLKGMPLQLPKQIKRRIPAPTPVTSTHLTERPPIPTSTHLNDLSADIQYSLRQCLGVESMQKLGVTCKTHHTHTDKYKQSLDNFTNDQLTEVFNRTDFFNRTDLLLKMVQRGLVTMEYNI